MMKSARKPEKYNMKGSAGGNSSTMELDNDIVDPAFVAGALLAQEAKNAIRAKAFLDYLRDRGAMAWTPPVDVRLGAEKQLLFEVDMPGAKKKDVKVQVEGDDVLVVSWERRRPDDKEKMYVRTERRMGKFVLRFSLPGDADLNNISATFQHGVLTVTVRRLQRTAEPKKGQEVEVKAAGSSGGGGGERDIS